MNYTYYGNQQQFEKSHSFFHHSILGCHCHRAGESSLPQFSVSIRIIIGVVRRWNGSLRKSLYKKFVWWRHRYLMHLAFSLCCRRIIFIHPLWLILVEPTHWALSRLSMHTRTQTHSKKQMFANWCVMWVLQRVSIPYRSRISVAC